MNDVLILCCDENMETFYRWDDNNSEWIVHGIVFPDDSEFTQYGVSEMTSDAGLPDSYRILVKTTTEPQSVEIDVVPNTQRIDITLDDNIEVETLKIDIDDYDDSVYDASVNVNHVKVEDEPIKTHVQLELTKNTVSDEKLKVYLTDIFSI